MLSLMPTLGSAKLLSERKPPLCSLAANSTGPIALLAIFISRRDDYVNIKKLGASFAMTRFYTSRE